MATEAPPAPTPAKGESLLGTSTMPSSLKEKMRASVAKYAEGGTSEVPVTPATPEPKKPDAPKPEPVAVPPKAQVAPEKKVDDKKDDEEKQSPKELREAFERNRVKLTEMESEGLISKKTMQEQQAKLKVMEDEIARSRKEIEEDLKPRAQKLSEYEKRLEEVQAKLKIRDFTATDEWREKYDKPLAEARTSIDLLVSDLEVQTSEGQARRGKFEDFLPVLQAETTTQAIALAKQIFGPDMAQVVVTERNRIRNIQKSRAEAIKNAELEATQYYENQKVSAAKDLETRKARLFDRFNKISEAEPDVFKAADDDAEHAALIQEGLTAADRFILGDPTMTPDDQISRLAEVRANEVRVKVQKRQLARKDARIAELEAELKEFKASEPKVGGSTSGTAPKNDLNDRESLRRDMAARAAKYATKP